jgi:membrane protein CcdC involved in cytochrome C biogenesis
VKTNQFIRQAHRWISLVFMLIVLTTTAIMMQENPPEWANYLALPPLFLLMLTGTYLFLIPYFSRGRASEPVARKVD